MRYLVVAVILATLPLVSAGNALAQYDADVFVVPVNARPVGMGFSGVADNSDASTVFFNPANVVGGHRAYLTGSTVHFDDPYDLGLSLRRAEGGGSWKFSDESAWTFGAQMAYTRLGLDEEAFGYTDDVDDDVWALALGVGVDEGNVHVRVGAAAKRLNIHTYYYDYESNEERIGENQSYAYDAGIVLSYQGDETDWNVVPQLGISRIDDGDPIYVADYPMQLPTRTIAGFSVRFASPLTEMAGARIPKFTTVINVDKENSDGMWSTGVEFSWARVLYLRAGQTDVSGTSGNLTWGIGLGLPYRWARVRFDYAKQDVGYINDQVSLLLAAEF